MWKNILKAATREEDYARLVESLDKILAGEVDPVKDSLSVDFAMFNFDDHEIILTPNEPRWRNRIALRPLSPHDEFITRLYVEEYRDNFPRLRNLVKKLAYKSEAEGRPQNFALFERIIHTLESVIFSMVKIVSDHSIGENDNSNRSLRYRSRMLKRFAPQLTLHKFKLAFPAPQNPRISEVWKYTVSMYVTDFFTKNTASTIQMNSFLNFLLGVGLEDILGESRKNLLLTEFPKIYSEEGQDLDIKMESRLDNHPEIYDLFDEYDGGPDTFDNLADLFR